MAGTPGAFTTDDVPTNLLYTELIDSVELHNQGRNWQNLFCGSQVTKKKVYDISYQGLTFQKLGADTDQPDMQHVPHREKDLLKPTRWGLNASITRRAWEEGLSSDKIRQDHQAALSADYELVSQSCLQPALTDGGWYDQTIIPPPFEMNRFLVTHDHYLAAAAGGTPTLALIADAKQHIIEHGYTRDFIGFINSTQAQAIEGIPEWATYVGPATPFISRLQEYGIYPEFRAAGVMMSVTDWIPPNYMLVMSLQEYPMVWRVEEGVGVEDLIVHAANAMGPTPNVLYQWIEDYIRWVSATIIAPGAGVAYFLNGGAWVDSAGWMTP